MHVCMHVHMLSFSTAWWKRSTEARPLQRIERGEMCHACPSGVDGGWVGEVRGLGGEELDVDGCV